MEKKSLEEQVKIIGSIMNRDKGLHQFTAVDKLNACLSYCHSTGNGDHRILQDIEERSCLNGKFDRGDLFTINRFVLEFNISVSEWC